MWNKTVVWPVVLLLLIVWPAFGTVAKQTDHALVFGNPGYFVERAVESIELALPMSDASSSVLLSDFASRHWQELLLWNEKNGSPDQNRLAAAYVEDLEAAIFRLEKAKAAGEDVQRACQALAKASDVDTQALSLLPASQSADIRRVTDDARLTVKAMDTLSVAAVRDLADRGWPVGSIGAAYEKIKTRDTVITIDGKPVPYF
jgi:hypothetical protein